MKEAERWHDNHSLKEKKGITLRNWIEKKKGEQKEDDWGKKERRWRKMNRERKFE